MTILVTGANGTVSSHLLHSLAAVPGTKVRALVRDPAKAPAVRGVDVVVGDLDEPSSLTEPFSGIDTLFLLNAMGPQAPHASMNAVWAARQAGVRHIVRLSAVGAAHDAPTRNGRLHALSDAELVAAGSADIDWTILRPHFFMQNQFGSVNGDTVYAALGDGRLGMVDARDIADVAAAVLADPQPHAGKIYTLTGSASISLHDAAADLTAVLGTPIRYQPISGEAAYQAMIGFGLPEWIAAVAVEYSHAYSAGWGDFVTTHVVDVLGRPPRSFAEFARDHAEYLRAG